MPFQFYVFTQKKIKHVHPKMSTQIFLSAILIFYCCITDSHKFSSFKITYTYYLVVSMSGIQT